MERKPSFDFTLPMVEIHLYQIILCGGVHYPADIQLPKLMDVVKNISDGIEIVFHLEFVRISSLLALRRAFNEFGDLAVNSKYDPKVILDGGELFISMGDLSLGDYVYFALIDMVKEQVNGLLVECALYLRALLIDQLNFEEAAILV
jgi:hypothetical protein